VAFDSLEAGVEARPALVKLNAAEAASLTGRPTADAAGAAAAARALHEATGGGAIVTRGSEGAVSVSPDGRGVAAQVSEHGRYPVGSGDAFLAGMVVALDGGAGWDDALAAAVGAGSANAELPGAGVLDPARAREITSRARLFEV
jgi:fructose-1-phosphate kinase PfkB-like protein